MYKEINLHEFRKAFEFLGQENPFSYGGLEVLFNRIEQFEKDTGEPQELNVIGLTNNYFESDEEEIRACYDIGEEESIEEFLTKITWFLGMHETNGKKFYLYQRF